jgi:UDP-N-acetylmuramoyl-tripeptide--D-alanyl-D-alanine ligase
MKAWSVDRLAEAAGARVVFAPSRAHSGPSCASIDSRSIGAGELFVGLRGEHSDGGAHARGALARGAWGVLVSPQHSAQAAAAAAEEGTAVVLEHEQPLASLQALARAWREELGTRGAKVVAITGSTGKTSTKDILAALLGHRLRTHASPENFNTEIGLPLALLSAPQDTQALVLEMAMRGSGQIAELTAIALPDVGVVLNVGHVHVELLGSVEGVAAAKAELIAGMHTGAVAVVPAHEPLLAQHLRDDLATITFGDGGDVKLIEHRPDGEVVIDDHGERIVVRPSFSQPHNVRNLLAAIAAARPLGVRPPAELAVTFQAMRGERVATPLGAVVISDCYNANPMSMRAAIDDLVATAPGRRVAVLGDMLELGPEGPELHREVGRYAAEQGIELLVTVGPLAAQMDEGFGGELCAAADADEAARMIGGLVRSGDTVLVKGSRGVALERVVDSLARRGA